MLTWLTWLEIPFFEFSRISLQTKKENIENSKNKIISNNQVKINNE